MDLFFPERLSRSLSLAGVAFDRQKRVGSRRMNFFRQCMYMLFAVAFLTATSLGAHMHLCSDGSESCYPVHVFEGQQDAHQPSTEEHTDVDVKPAHQALVKLLKFDPSWAALPSSWKVPVVSLAAAIDPPVERRSFSASSHRSLPPPQRGPPV